MALTKEERELLTRLDERTRNIWRLVESMERHQEESNGHQRVLIGRVATNTAWRHVFQWIIGGIITALTAIWARIQGIF